MKQPFTNFYPAFVGLYAYSAIVFMYSQNNVSEYPTMQEREARLLFKSNDLNAAKIEQASDNKSWTIRFIDKNQNSHHLVSKRDTAPRRFKTSDAALRCCLRIGFKQVEVVI